MEHVLLSGEVDGGSEGGVDFLPQFLLQLGGGVHAVLGRGQDAAHPPLLLLTQLACLPLLQDALDQPRGCAQAPALLAQSARRHTQR